MVFSIFWPFTPTLSSTFLCDIFLSISTCVRRKLAWDIFWHDLPLEGLLKWTNQRSLISNVALLCLMRFKRHPKLIFCQLTLKPGVSHNQSVEAKKVNFPTSLNAHPHIAKISVSWKVWLIYNIAGKKCVKNCKIVPENRASNLFRAKKWGVFSH